MADGSKTCRVETCNRGVRARGLCSGHYQRLMAGIPLDRPAHRKRSVDPETDKTCTVEGCARALRARGMCSMHWSRWRNTGDAGEAEARPTGSPPRPPQDCWVDGCQRTAVQRLKSERPLCNLHALRWHRTGDVRGSEPEMGPRHDGALCSVNGCDRAARVRGMCSTHRRQVREGRDPQPIAPRRSNGGVNINTNGYGWRTVNGGRYLEHRVVMEGILGRPLASFENVHHVNGVRHDNRPENLELWTRPQPKGQRPEDLAEWVVEMYPELVEAALANRAQLRFAH